MVEKKGRRQERMRAKSFLIVALMLAAMPASLWQGIAQEQDEVILEIPHPINYISDYADIVDEETEAALDRSVEHLEGETGARIMVLTVESIKPLEIAEYSLETFQQWRLGDYDVLFLVALEDNKTYIEVGDKLKEVLPDKELREILDREILPSFNEGKFWQGIQNGVSSMAVTIIESLEKPAPPRASAQLNIMLVAIVIVVLAAAVIILL